MEQELDLKIVWHMFVKHIKFISVITVAVTIIAFLVSYFVISPKYTSEALLYVENKQNSTDNLNINDITAAQKLVNTCSILFTSDSMLDKLKAELELNYSMNALSKMITVESVNSSEILKITVITENTAESEKIASKLVELSQSEFLRVVKSGTIEVVSNPMTSSTPTSPNIPLYTAIGLILGFIGACAIVILRELFNVTVNEDDDLYKIYNVPVFAEIMDFQVKAKEDYKYE